MHNLLFVQHVYIPTEQAQTYLKFFVLIYHLTYICASLFGWKENMIVGPLQRVRPRNGILALVLVVLVVLVVVLPLRSEFIGEL